MEPDRQLRDHLGLVLCFHFAHEWLYRLHSRWFRLPVATFDAIHYAGMALYKIGVLLLNVAPLIALYLVFKG